ncbi:hypothetical protein BH708_02675 [Brachybacterium sp. P6-10-X1]|uniref:hypothetical protein n=1 Tax=Brachybacterium sp. P6-10-X1 TaxID=1903186 RepID=UPI0009718282|nr:hypothetical protein [Brachybacterium sp. P6-10-X1]APX31799.1 hypothetical protein BH708_02675 [Brachybacterium sp. P6-10-X1]
MASLIESVRKLHGPHLVAHENGYDVDVTCDECTRLRLEALDQAAGQGEDLAYCAESVRVPYPCPTRIVAGTTETEGREEAARMRLDRLAIQREEIEEQIERLDAVIALIRRDLGEADDEVDDIEDAREHDDEQPESIEVEEPASPKPARKAKTKAEEPKTGDTNSEESPAEPEESGDEFDF